MHLGPIYAELACLHIIANANNAVYTQCQEVARVDSPNRPPKLMDRVKATMRLKRYSPRTEKTYCYWIRYFIRFHGVRHPANMGATEVQAFLEHLAVERYVAAATQNQALNALVFFYRHVLEQLLGDIGAFSHAKRPRRLPIVLSHDEVMRVLNRLSDPMHLMATLMYGSGLRVCLQPVSLPCGNRLPLLNSNSRIA